MTFHPSVAVFDRQKPVGLSLSLHRTTPNTTPLYSLILRPSIADVVVSIIFFFLLTSQLSNLVFVLKYDEQFLHILICFNCLNPLSSEGSDLPATELAELD